MLEPALPAEDAAVKAAHTLCKQSESSGPLPTQLETFQGLVPESREVELGTGSDVLQ